MGAHYVIGIDYGSDSVRAILVDTQSAKTVDTAVAEYPRWREGRYCNDKISQYRQHPMDYLECLEMILKKLLVGRRHLATEVVGIAVDTTGSTVCPVDEKGTPLAMKTGFEEEPDAMFHLWKDHTAIAEAEEINHVLSCAKIDYTKYQGEYSAEWFWAKILRTVRHNPSIRDNAYCWVEHVDWIAGVLTGNTLPETIAHCSCAAGHKALWNSEFKGLPERETLSSMDPYLGMIYDRYSQKPKHAGENIGTLCKEWADKLGLSENTVIGMGSFDAHAGAVGVGITEKTMVKVVGTSTVDMMIVKPNTVSGKNSKAYCGLAEDSIIPGFMGVEAGQSAFGDTYAWLKRFLTWPLESFDIPEEILGKEAKGRLSQYLCVQMLRELENQAMELQEDELTALDWFNGRRYPRLNESITSSITGLTLSTMPPSVYRALVRATVFGSRRIYDSLKNLGIDIQRIICVGGIAQKSSYIMQTLCDSLNVPIMVSAETQSCARGAAIYAAVASGLYEDISEAQKELCEEYHPTYHPDKENGRILEKKYRLYCALGDVTEKRLLGEME
ncbi:ribulokinase [Blautia schinkii]|nr:ribulokinase [Blautia schinkii]